MAKQKITPNQISSPYVFHAKLSGAVNTTNAGWQKIPLNAEEYDPGGNFDTTNNRYVAPVTGYYFISGSMTYVSATADTIRIASLQVNGVEQARGTEMSPSLTMNFTCTVASMIYMTAGQYVELWGYSSTVTALGTSAFTTYMKGTLLSV